MNLSLLEIIPGALVCSVLLVTAASGVVLLARHWHEPWMKEKWWM